MFHDYCRTQFGEYCFDKYYFIKMTLNMYNRVLMNYSSIIKSYLAIGLQCNFLLEVSQFDYYHLCSFIPIK